MGNLDGMMNGHAEPAPERAGPATDEAQILAAMEHSHTFPGFYPVVVIGHHDEAFFERLSAALLVVQGSEPYTVRRRDSAGGRYVAFHVELFVDTARTALARKASLAGVEGVLWLL